MKTSIISFPNGYFSGLPKEDSAKFKQKNQRLVACVSDGITRDPILEGKPRIPLPGSKNFKEDFILKYPKPSPAKTAADLISSKSVKLISPGAGISKINLGLEKANSHLKGWNALHFPNPNYLDKDLAGCVAVAYTINKKKVYYSYTGDCGLAIFNIFGKKIKFIAPDLGPRKRMDQIISKQGLSWSDNKYRLIVRKKYRNNPEEPMSFGAFTGEKIVKKFIKSGRLSLSSGDLVIGFTDGVRPYLENLKTIANKNSGFNIKKIKTFLSSGKRGRKERTSIITLIE